ncbi:hypothetical protein [Streptomyces sp. 5-10]|uniref:hypothetical protein n=1 Tax=Streptomyces sp. 5-10 TaxID=878925 RepID=UPI00168A5A3A|nr:hypothetical protein [Streptomyces sp. 5-10]MBD3004785.1 hypothetical protein [Streptomyces sp. 5-10]
MTDLDVIKELEHLFGGSFYRREPGKKHWKVVYSWTVRGELAIKVLGEIRKYMFARRGFKIEEILEAWESDAEAREKRERFLDNVTQAAKEYIAARGGVSCRSVARKYGVSNHAVKKYASSPSLWV